MNPETKKKEWAVAHGPWSLLFNTAYTLFGLSYLPVFLVKIRQAADPSRLMRERMGNIDAQMLAGRRVIWLHAVSVGEVMAVRKFITGFLERFPGYFLALTTVTPTGQKIAKELEGERVKVFYFPFDLHFACRRFFEKLRPECLLLAETEIWPNLLLEASRASVPVGLLNARLSEKSSRRYGKFPSIFKPLFQSLDFVLAQTQKDAEHFHKLGVAADKIQVLGNMKFDQMPATESSPRSAEQLKNEFGIPADSLVWIAGSTHPGEEEILGRVYASLKQKFPRLKLVIAPRHIERSGRIAESLRGSGLKTALSTQPQEGFEILILDRLGVLKNLYQIADVVFVGGSLVPKGGQNPIEPSAFKKAVLHGPHVFNFEQVYEWLDQKGGALPVNDEAWLSRGVEKFLENGAERSRAGEIAFSTVREFCGATARHLDYLADHLHLPERIKDVDINPQLFPPAGRRL